MITIITDGSADNKTRKGGWAAVIRNSTTLVELTGWAEDTTSNRMELMAAVGALKSISVPTDITVVTDSSYLRNTMKREWYKRWFEEGSPRPNLDLWHQLAGLATFHNITWVKVKGHSGDYWNDRVDFLAAWARTSRQAIENKMEINEFRCPKLNTEIFPKTSKKKQCGLYAGHGGVCDFRRQPAIV